MAAVEMIEQVNNWATLDLEKTIRPEGYYASALDQNFGVHFGRDAAITSTFTLDIYEKHPERKELLLPVKNSLTTMALYQGQEIVDSRDEEPGKIRHEIRIEDALIDIPEAYKKNQEILDRLYVQGWAVEGEKGKRIFLYCGSVDATLLFVSVASRYLLLTEDKEFFQFLDPHLRRAIAWMEQYGDIYGDGYIRFQAKNRNALINQGWMDSYDSIEISPGKRPREPIALVEVQGYAYQSYVTAAKLYQKAGDFEYSKHLYQKAGILKQRFNTEFWMEDERFFAQALSGDNRQVRDIVSNVGHLLATGIVDDEKTPAVVNRLMQPDMLSPWGPRTRSLDSPNFADIEPAAYHKGGTVWPHDGAMIARGMRKLGYEKEATIVEERLLLAGMKLQQDHDITSEEVFIVDRNNQLRPYATAQKPQSWAAAAFKAISTV